MKKISIVLTGSIFLWLAAADSFAVSLGRHQGATLVGRPLEVTVQAVLDAQDDLASLCIEADVFYADTKLDKSRIRVTAERVSSGSQNAVIKIRAASPVDEPVVTVYVRVGCQQKIERRYVMLADMASEMVADKNQATLAVPPISNKSAVVTSPNASATSSDQANTNPESKVRNSPTSPTLRSPRSSRSSRSSQAAELPPKPQTSANAASPSVLAETAVGSNVDGNVGNSQNSAGAKSRGLAGKQDVTKARASNRSRLKLEPLDLTSEREPQLKSSAALLSTPSASLQERTAAAALWRAIASQPQDIVRDFEKLQTLESSVRSLQAQSQKTQQSVIELDVKLQNAESDRYANVLVYALAFLLLLALAVLLFLLRKRSARELPDVGDKPWPWWRKRESQNNLRHGRASRGEHDDYFYQDPLANFNRKNSEMPRKTGFADSGVDVNISQADVVPIKQSSNTLSEFATEVALSLGPNYQSDFATSLNYPSRAVKAEELFDVQQQADFFVSIGQYEQAIDVLRNHIGDGVDTSAVVYLDLFNLYHQLDRKADYAALRANFNARFNTKIPVFEMYGNAGFGLEAYELALSRIVALWPSPKVLEVIEESIFRRPESTAEAFDLLAYRELLMLYSVAKEIIDLERKNSATPDTNNKIRNSIKFAKTGLPKSPIDHVDSRPMKFAFTTIQPLSAIVKDDQAVRSNDVSGPVLKSTVPPPSLHLGLDLDLSEPMPTKARPVAHATESYLPGEASALVDKNTGPVTSQLGGLSHDINPSAPDAGNLIDFHAFDGVLGNRTRSNKKSKPPKL